MPKPGVIGPPAASEHLKLGIDLIADLLAPTLGPVGGLVANQGTPPRPVELLDDAATAVRRILSLGDQKLDIGAMLLRHLVWRVTEKVGDGGAMTALLTRTLYHEGTRLLAAGVNPIALNQGVAAATARVLQALQQQARPIETENELAALALTVTHDPPLAAVLGEMSYLLGPTAHVTITKHVAPYLERRYIAGACYPAEIASPYLYTEPVQKRTIIADSALVLVDDPLTEPQQVVSLLEAALQRGSKGLTIVAPSISQAALGILLANQLPPQTERLFLAANLKVVGEERHYALHDLALLTGATLLGSHQQRGPNRVIQADLGQAMRVEFANGTLAVVTANYQRPEIQNEANHLRHYLETLALDAAERPLAVKRLAALTGGIGELKIGAFGKPELEIMQQRAERALKVLAAAHHGGVVAGGGAALYHCLPALCHLKLDEEAAFGVRIVAQALAVPLKQILENGAIAEPTLVMRRLAEAGPPAAFDVLQGQVVDAHQAGLLDPLEVVQKVMVTAASGAMSALKTDVIVYHRQPEQSGPLTP